MWRAIIPAVLGACLALGSLVPASGQAAAESGQPAAPETEQARQIVVFVPALPAVVYVGNIPLLLTARQVIVVQDGARVLVVPVYGRFIVNGTPVAILRPTQVIVVRTPPARGAPGS